MLILYLDPVLVNEMQTPIYLLPLPKNSEQIGIKDAQCAETYEIISGDMVDFVLKIIRIFTKKMEKIDVFCLKRCAMF